AWWWSSFCFIGSTSNWCGGVAVSLRLPPLKGRETNGDAHSRPGRLRSETSGDMKGDGNGYGRGGSFGRVLAGKQHMGAHQADRAAGLQAAGDFPDLLPGEAGAAQRLAPVVHFDLGGGAVV